ncbi:MAG TPA: flagellar basal body P-ring formation chaperone FlgA [Devosia sp.]|nr:flagellar basal body P-ring formation chaperone FlgA [Devosia sp.]
MKQLLHFLGVGILGLLACGPAFAAPTLRPQVEVTDKIVTVGDMFDDAGDLAAQPLFLAPAPGTSGSVALDDVRLAAQRAGLATFDDGGTTAVRVTRRGTVVDAQKLGDLLTDELRRRGTLTGDATLDVTFAQRLDDIEAADVTDPVQLTDLRYAAENGTFTARFALAGIDSPLEVSGRLDFMVQVPELANTLPAGTILKPADITMQPVSLRLVQNGNVASLDQLIGQQLVRQSRAGMMLKASDVAPPQVVARNDQVTVYLHAGAMTLSVKGTALNAASLGDPVAVMNSASKRIVRGVARGNGAVEITAAPTSVAGL